MYKLEFMCDKFWLKTGVLDKITQFCFSANFSLEIQSDFDYSSILIHTGSNFTITIFARLYLVSMLASLL